MGSQGFNPLYGRRLGRRGLLRGAALGVSGIALWGVGCSSSNNNKGSATTAPTRAASAAATSATTPSAAASSAATRAASPAAAGSPAAAAVSQFGWTNNKPDLTLQPKKGGTFHYSGHVQAPSLDPVKSASYESANIYEMVYNGLIRAQYGTELQPYNPWQFKLTSALAEMPEHPDAMTYTFKLKPNVKFQNVDPVKGRAFTSADAKYTLDLFLANPETASQLPFTVTAPDDQTVQLKLTKPANYVLPTLADSRFVMLPHEVADADGDFSKRAIGTGPFILDNYQPNTTAHYKRNPDYFRTDRPYLDAIQLDNFKDNATSKAAFISGQYEYAEYALLNPFDDIKDILAARKDTVVMKLQSRWQSNIFYIGFAADKDPWKDQRVRTALSKGFDRSVFGKKAYNGDYNVQGIYSWIDKFDSAPDLGDAYKFDPQAAKQMLAAAGQTSLKVPLDYFPYGGDADDQLQTIQQQLKDIGVVLQLNKLGPTEFFTKFYGQKTDNAAVGFVPTTPRWEPVSMLVLWHSGSPKNYLRVSDPALDAALDKVTTIEDPNEQKAAYRDAWMKLHQPTYFFTIDEAPTFFIHSPKLHGFLPNQYHDIAGWGNASIEDFWLDT